MYEKASQVASDAVGSIRTVASFCAEEKVLRFYRDRCSGPLKTGIKQGLTNGAGVGVSYFLLYCVYAASFYAGARLVEAGTTTFPNVFRVSGLRLEPTTCWLKGLIVESHLINWCQMPPNH